MTRRFRRLIAFLLAGFFCLTTGSFAVAGVSSELQHEVGQTESHTPPQGEEGKGCDHCCACHFSAHLFSAANAELSGFITPLSQQVEPARLDQALPRPTDTFFKPPRIS